MTWKDFWKVPMDYEAGFRDGFVSGLRFYKSSIDKMHKAVLTSKKVRDTINQEAVQKRK